MSLLSKEERQTLTPDEKRALRKERRAVRREERGPILGIKWEKTRAPRGRFDLRNRGRRASGRV